MNRLPYLFALLCLLLTACSGSSTSSPNTGTAITPTPTITHAATPTPAPSHFTVGQTVKVGSTWQLTVLSAKHGGTATYLKPGQVFLDLAVKAVNISSSEQTMSSLASWSVRDGEGTTYQAGYDPGAGPALDGKVEAGQPLKGSLTFVVSNNVHSYLLLFQADFASSGQTIWDITV